jgi:hypothetical protein
MGSCWHVLFCEKMNCDHQQAKLRMETEVPFVSSNLYSLHVAESISGSSVLTLEDIRRIGKPHRTRHVSSTPRG